jgi:pimeloyl-ACP methyl ester carboxylesterase
MPNVTSPSCANSKPKPGNCSRAWTSRIPSSQPACSRKTLPSWYLVTASDQTLPPDAERQFAARMGAVVVEIPSSHVAMVSHPGEVARLIETAAEAVPATS